MDEPTADLLKVGEVARGLGVAAATLRSWERRYGLAPSAQSDGGHRRYTPDDVARLQVMNTLLGRGVRAKEAAQLAQRPRTVAAGEDVTSPPSYDWDIDDLVPPEPFLKLPGKASPTARALAAHVSRLDANAMTGLLSEEFIRKGVTTTWEGAILPVLTAAGSSWARNGGHIDTEHVLVETTTAALAIYRRFLPRPAPARPVVLACTSQDVHTLAQHALSAVLTEAHRPALLLGARVPLRAAVSAMARSQAAALFLWRQTSAPDPEDDLLRKFLSSVPKGKVLLGGPGWDHLDLPAASDLQVRSLTEAADRLIPD